MSSPFRNSQSPLRTPVKLGRGLTENSPSPANAFNDDKKEKKHRRRLSMADELRRRAITESPRGNVAAQQVDSPVKVATKRHNAASDALLSSEQKSDLYASCIKLSTENKINQKNSWDLGLIDYISDVLETKHGEMTNFQVASCTLDASVKIYSCRVDSIHQEAYKVLGGLTRSNKDPVGHKTMESDNDEDDEDEDGNKRVKKTGRSKKRTVNTLETNLEALDVKQHELEFEVDPLFQKTSAAFDEGGARGLLLNHLNVYNGCELVFDSAGSVDPCADAEPSSPADADLVDVSSLQTLCASFLAEAPTDSTAGLAALDVCAAFKDFCFNDWTPAADGDDDLACDTSSAAPQTPSTTNAPPSSAYAISNNLMAFHDDENNDDEDLPGGGGFDMGGLGLDSDDEDIHYETGLQAGGSGGPASGVVMAMLQAGNEYSYFDQSHLKNWAGPDHWRVRGTAGTAGTAAGAATANDKKRSAKEPFFLDFEAKSAPGGKTWEAALSSSRVTTTLAQTTLDKLSASTTTLPDDCHFQVADLTRLFLKARWGAQQNQRVRTGEPSDVDGSSGGQWYNYDNANDCNNYCAADETGNGGGGGVDDDDYGLGHPQGGCDSDSDDDDNDMFLGGGPDDCDGALINEPRMVNKIQINYAKTAKKVDVRAVKGTIWSELTGKSDATEAAAAPAEGTRMFADIVQIVPTKMPSKAANEMSVPIAFVCLLHLANEKHLAIKGVDAMDNLLIEQA